jgi:Na+/H+ antiporter NhaD/arsenite permease-like protein
MLLSVVAALSSSSPISSSPSDAHLSENDRPGAAIVGAILMIAAGVISLDKAYRHIDFRTLVLLFGMWLLS